MHDINSIKKCNIEELVLRYEVENRFYYKDFGNLCYSFFKKPTATSFSKVVLTSIIQSRKDVLKNYLISELLRGAGIHTIMSNIGALNLIFKYINNTYPNINLKFESECYKLFQDFTNYLISRVVSVGKNSLNSDYAYQIQSILANFLALCLNKPASDIILRSKPIPKDVKNDVVWSVNEYDLEAFFLYNVSTFLNIKDFLMQEKEFPINFNFSYEEHNIKVDFTYDGIPSSIKENKSSNWYQRHESLANRAIHSFLFSFACVTAANLSSLQAIEISNFKTVPSTQGKRTFIRKNRASGDEVPVEFGVDFLSIYNEYIEFRSWLLNKYSKKYISKFKYYLFINIPPDKNSLKSAFNTLTIINSSTIASYKVWFTQSYPIKWIPLRGIRQIVSTDILKKTNSSRVASLKLGNSPRTFIKNYGKTTFNDSANEMSNALDNIFDSIINNNYILKESEIDSFKTPIGSCLNIEKKSIFPEIDIEPDCRRPESCLFCSNFVLHPDKHDIKKLLSVLDMFKLSNKKNTNQAIIIQDRIISILEEMQKKFPETKEFINLVQDEIDEGDIDEYWAEISLTLALLDTI